VKLHHIPGARSCRVRWLLEELGWEYELQRHQLGGESLHAPGYLRLNPLGKVPTLEDAGQAFYESGAIVEALLERDDEQRLAPAPGSPERPLFLQWLYWSEATLMGPLAEIMMQRFRLPDPEKSAGRLEQARKHFQRLLEILSQALGTADYLVGNAFTAADIMVAYPLNLARLVKELPDEPARATAYLDLLSRRPAFQRAFAD